MVGFARRGMSGWSDAARGAGRADRAAPWILLVFSGGTVLSAVLQRHLFEQTQTAQHLVEFNIGEAFALAALLALIRAAGRGLTLARSDSAVLALAALAWFLPEQHGIYLATTLGGLWVLLRTRSDRHLIGIGQVWLALSVYELWGKLVFKLVYQVIEGIEVGLIYGVGRLLYDGLGIVGASLSVRGDWSIVILEGCSSFHNLSLAVLVWLSILKIAGHGADRAAFGALAAGAGLVVTINVARILAMLPSREAYHFWHEGLGSSLVAFASVAAIIGPTLLRIEGPACVPSRPC